MNDAKYITLTDLDQYGLRLDDMRERCPWATEYTALDGRSCWLAADLERLIGERGGAE
jgi:hypothetical protein